MKNHTALVALLLFIGLRSSLLAIPMECSEVDAPKYPPLARTGMDARPRDTSTAAAGGEGDIITRGTAVSVSEKEPAFKNTSSLSSADETSETLAQKIEDAEAAVELWSEQRENLSATPYITTEAAASVEQQILVAMTYWRDEHARYFELAQKLTQTKPSKEERAQQRLLASVIAACDQAATAAEQARARFYELQRSSSSSSSAAVASEEDIRHWNLTHSIPLAEAQLIEAPQRKNRISFVTSFIKQIKKPRPQPPAVAASLDRSSNKEGEQVEYEKILPPLPPSAPPLSEELSAQMAIKEKAEQAQNAKINAEQIKKLALSLESAVKSPSSKKSGHFSFGDGFFPIRSSTASSSSKQEASAASLRESQATECERAWQSVLKNYNEAIIKAEEAGQRSEDLAAEAKNAEERIEFWNAQLAEARRAVAEQAAKIEASEYAIEGAKKIEAALEITQLKNKAAKYRLKARAVNYPRETEQKRELLSNISRTYARAAEYLEAAEEVENWVPSEVSAHYRAVAAVYQQRIDYYTRYGSLYAGNLYQSESLLIHSHQQAATYLKDYGSYLRTKVQTNFNNIIELYKQSIESLLESVRLFRLNRVFAFYGSYNKAEVLARAGLAFQEAAKNLQSQSNREIAILNQRGGELFKESVRAHDEGKPKEALSYYNAGLASLTSVSSSEMYQRLNDRVKDRERIYCYSDSRKMNRNLYSDCDYYRKAVKLADQAAGVFTESAKAYAIGNTIKGKILRKTGDAFMKAAQNNNDEAATLYGQASEFFTAALAVYDAGDTLEGKRLIQTGNGCYKKAEKLPNYFPNERVIKIKSFREREIEEFNKAEKQQEFSIYWP